MYWQWLSISMHQHHEVCVVGRYGGGEEGGRGCMYAISWLKLYALNIIMLFCCVMCVHNSADTNNYYVCCCMMLFLQTASPSQPLHPLPHLLAPMLPHKSLVSKALYSQCWTHITCDAKQWVHALAINCQLYQLYILENFISVFVHLRRMKEIFVKSFNDIMSPTSFCFAHAHQSSQAIKLYMLVLSL